MRFAHASAVQEFAMLQLERRSAYEKEHELFRDSVRKFVLWRLGFGFRYNAVADEE